MGFSLRGGHYMPIEEGITKESLEEIMEKQETFKVTIESDKERRTLEGKSILSVALTEHAESIDVNIGMIGIWGPNIIASAASETIAYLAKSMKDQNVPSALALSIIMNGIKDGMQEGFGIDPDTATKEEVEAAIHALVESDEPTQSPAE
jgi:hypothetical protein